MSESLEPDSSLTHEQPTAQAADVSVLKKYLLTVVPPLLEDDGVLHPSLQALLDDPVQQEKLKKFIGEVQVKSLLVQRTSNKGAIGSAIGRRTR